MTDGIPDGFEAVSHVEGERLNVALVGELDMTASFGLEAEVERLLGQHAVGQVVLDLADLEFLDSAGLGALLTLRNHAQDLGVELRFVSPSRPVRRILEVTGTAPLLLEPGSAG